MIAYEFKGLEKSTFDDIHKMLSVFDDSDCPLISQEQIEELSDNWDIVSQYLACYPSTNELSLVTKKEAQTTIVDVYRKKEKAFVLSIDDNNNKQIDVEILEKRYQDENCRAKRRLLNLQNYFLAKKKRR